MGQITRSFRFTGTPSETDWNVDVDALFSLVNGSIDSTNVTTSGSTGIATLATASTFVARQTFSAGVVVDELLSVAAAGAGHVKIADIRWDPASGTLTNNDGFYLSFTSDDSTATPVETEYARIAVNIDDKTDGSEDGSLRFSVMTAGTLAAETILTGAAFYPAANDGNALGISGTAWSDLFLASGAVVDFNAGDVVLTHSLNTLTLSGGNLALGANSLTAGSILANSDDVGALGASGTAWSDLFLASGAVVNFAAGDVTITHAANVLAFAGASTRYSFDAPVLVGTTTPSSFMTTGVLLNQSTADNEILAFQSSTDVAHGMTDLADTSTYGTVSKAGNTAGGVRFTGYTSGTIGVQLVGNGTTANATRSTSGSAAIVLQVGLKSGTSNGSIGADKNMVCIQDQTTTRFIFDSDGDSHQDVGTAWTNFDFADDVQVLDALAVAIGKPDDSLQTQFVRSLEESRELLEKLPGKPIVSFNEDGHHFVNWSRLAMLQHGALRQAYRRIEKLESNFALLAERN